MFAFLWNYIMYKYILPISYVYIGLQLDLLLSS
jgi:hypothetical protein